MAQAGARRQSRDLRRCRGPRNRLGSVKASDKARLREAVRSFDRRGKESGKAVKTRTKPNIHAYRFTVRPLTSEEGGGYLVEYPEIPGCMSDGETVEEAIANGREALRDTLQFLKATGRK